MGRWHLGGHAGANFAKHEINYRPQTMTLAPPTRRNDLSPRIHHALTPIGVTSQFINNNYLIIFICYNIYLLLKLILKPSLFEKCFSANFYTDVKRKYFRSPKMPLKI